MLSKNCIALLLVSVFASGTIGKLMYGKIPVNRYGDASVFVVRQKGNVVNKNNEEMAKMAMSDTFEEGYSVYCYDSETNEIHGVLALGLKDIKHRNNEKSEMAFKRFKVKKFMEIVALEVDEKYEKVAQRLLFYAEENVAKVEGCNVIAGLILKDRLEKLQLHAYNSIGYASTGNDQNKIDSWCIARKF